MEQLPTQIRERADYWANHQVFDHATKSEISALLRSNAVGELSDRFYRDLEFGTGTPRYSRSRICKDEYI